MPFSVQPAAVAHEIIVYGVAFGRTGEHKVGEVVIDVGQQPVPHSSQGSYSYHGPGHYQWLAP
jgi:hypothetical protein